MQDVELSTGMDRATIRYYEREGLIAPKREENGYRNYSDEDMLQLERINLLRQLGMPIDRIAGIQQGREDFSAALQLQIAVLDDKIHKQSRAQHVCQIIYDDRVQYTTLNPQRYMQLLKEERNDVEQPLNAEFREDVVPETHPWRRCFARCLDFLWFAAILDMLLFVVFRLRPVPLGIINILLSIASGFLFVPVEAFLLHKWGTTPGKLAFGISVETVDGMRPGYVDALNRSWCVFRCGCAYGIPFLELYFYIKNFRILTGRASDRMSSNRTPEWDEEFEVQYMCPTMIWIAVIVAVILSLRVCTASDMIKPTYRGAELTVSEFAQNYNATMRLLKQSTPKMQSDGLFSSNDAEYTIHIGGTPKNETYSFEYALNNNKIDKISYQNEWTEIFYLQLPDDRPFYAALTMLLAQKGTGWKDAIEFENLWYRQNFTRDGSFFYGKLYCSWTVELANCESHSNGYIICIDQNKPTTAKIQVVIDIV